MVYPLIDLLFPGLSLRHHRQPLPSVSFHSFHHANYAKCTMSNLVVTNVGAMGTFPDTALHMRSVPGAQVHMTFIVPLSLLQHQHRHVKTHHPRPMRNGNILDVTCQEGTYGTDAPDAQPSTAILPLQPHICQHMYHCLLLHHPALQILSQVPHRCLHYKKQLTHNLVFKAFLHMYKRCSPLRKFAVLYACQQPC